MGTNHQGSQTLHHAVDDPLGARAHHRQIAGVWLPIASAHASSRTPAGHRDKTRPNTTETITKIRRQVASESAHCHDGAATGTATRTPPADRTRPPQPSPLDDQF